MKANMNGLLAIEIVENNYRVIFHPENGTVWLDKNELCELFGCYLKDINNVILEIFQKKFYRMEDVCEYDLVMKGKKFTHEITKVNLDIIIAIAFRIENFRADIIRKWVLKRCAKYQEPLLSAHYLVKQNHQLN